MAARGSVGDPAQGAEHPAGEKPPSEETEYQQERPQDGRRRSEVAQESAASGRYEDVRAVDDDHLASGHISQEEHPHRSEQQGAGEHDEARVAEGELQANTQTRVSMQGLLPHARCPVVCQFGSRRRPRWR